VLINSHSMEPHNSIAAFTSDADGGQSQAVLPASQFPPSCACKKCRKRICGDKHPHKVYVTTNDGVDLVTYCMTCASGKNMLGVVACPGVTHIVSQVSTACKRAAEHGQGPGQPEYAMLARVALPHLHVDCKCVDDLFCVHTVERRCDKDHTLCLACRCVQQANLAIDFQSHQGGGGDGC
jgi:hypothetical protein